MAILNYVKREIVAKIVYYGPGLSGKTANIQKIHESMDPANVGELTSLATESDRTLFFDFVPIQLGSIAGLNTRFQLFTVPGQVFYNNTRKKVLEDADGVVFVADSQPEQLENNVESLKNLEENLQSYGKKPTDLPVVLQFNKQDLPGVMSEEELNKVLNKWGLPSIRASCIEGFGVMETLAKISTMVLAHLREQMTKKTAGAPPAGIKRTYSKEGVSDDQVVKNMLEDIAAAGGVAEMKAAEAAAKAPPPARPASGPMPAAKPVTGPMPAAKPAMPAPSKPAAAAPRPTPAPAASAKLAPTAPLSPEDLLSDLDAPAPPPPSSERPAAKPAAAREVVSRPPPKPAVAPPPPAAMGAMGPGGTKVLSGPAPVPAAEPAATPSMSRLKPAVPPPTPAKPVPAATANLKSSPAPARPAPMAAKTAEELLESIDAEERSGPGPMVQESAGSFGASGASSALWDDDGPTGAKPADKGAAFGLESLLDEEERDVSNKTSVAGGDKIKLAPAVPADEPPPEPSFVPNMGPGGADVLDSPHTDVKITPVPARGAAAAGATAPAAGSGRATAALFLSIVNTLLLLGLLAFNAMQYLGHR